MVITALTGRTVTPDEIAEKAMQRGFRICNAGSSSNIALVAQDYGLRVSGGINLSNVAHVNELLRSGAMIHTGGEGAKPFTSTGHVIAIRGVTADGKWRIFDSNRDGAENSTKDWDPAIIISGSAWNRVISK
jgi:hypothetical protein